MDRGISTVVVVVAIIALISSGLFLVLNSDSEQLYEFEFYEMYSGGDLSMTDELTGSSLDGSYYVMDDEDGTFLIINARIHVGDIDTGDNINRRPMFLFPNTMIIKKVCYGGGFGAYSVDCWTAYDGRPYSSLVYAGKDANTDGEVSLAVMVLDEYWSDNKPVSVSIGNGNPVRLALEPREHETDKGMIEVC